MKQTLKRIKLNYWTYFRNSEKSTSVIERVKLVDVSRLNCGGWSFQTFITLFAKNLLRISSHFAALHRISISDCRLRIVKSSNCKMVNGSRYYRALESVSMALASALSSALTIYPCQIRVHQRRQSKLQLPTARKKEWWPATAHSLPQAVTCPHCDTHYFSRRWTHNLPIVSPTRYQ